ncbi:hypothetical protein MAA_11826 [Metarhizium robertsii ARSEF 23]|uniref:Uncharacterized protein n=1 Tax=Metarhizium robertsii (strain ARSEF 23 / ATCC MYA-3075) TaxID=655844 RepID=A0A0B2X6Q2_METRA|nr:uncharacterized protein MAA_11826 [Metarhizium robertsii ARSEF 23]KHO10573.1 hypothetical protein MAA_11826 [Metarhizium robertsii ARSEF 23]
MDFSKEILYLRRFTQYGLLSGPILFTHYYVIGNGRLPKVAAVGKPTYWLHTWNEFDRQRFILRVSEISDSMLMHALIHSKDIAVIEAKGLSPRAFAPTQPAILHNDPLIGPDLPQPWGSIPLIVHLSLHFDIGTTYRQNIEESKDDKAILARQTVSSSLHNFLSAASREVKQLDISFETDRGFEEEYPAHFGVTLPNILFWKLETLTLAGFADLSGQFAYFLRKHKDTIVSVTLENINLGPGSLITLFRTLRELNLRSTNLHGKLEGSNREEIIDFSENPWLTNKFEEVVAWEAWKFEEWCNCMISRL